MILDKWVIKVVCLFAGCLSALPALAQDPNNERRRWEIFAEGGGSFHTSVSGLITLQFLQPPDTFTLRGTKSFAKTGRFFAGLRFHFDSKNHIEASYSYSPGRLNIMFSGFPFPQPRTRTIVGWLDYDYYSFNYIRRLPGRRKFEPFLTAGFGIVVFNHGSTDDETKPLGNIGMGFDIPINRRFSLRFEQRVFASGTPRSRVVVSGGPDPFEFKGKTYDFVPSVGLVWHF